MTQLPVAVALPPLIGAFLMPLIGRRWRAACYPLLVVILLISTLAGIAALVAVQRHGPIAYAFGGWTPPVGIAWSLDGLSALLAVVVSGGLLLTLLGLRHSIDYEVGERMAPFSTLLLLLTAGLLGLVCSADLFNVFVFLEVASLSAYALVAIGGPAGSFAAFQYLVMGTIGTSCYLLGVGQLYALTGTLNMADVAVRLAPIVQTPAAGWGLVLLLTGLGLKAALVPLHGWMPDAYAHAPSAVSALIAPVMTKVALYALIRVLGWVAPALWQPQTTMLFGLQLCAAVAIVAGSLWALQQSHLRRLLAYSSIAQIGVITLGISLGNAWGLVGALLHLLNDVCAKICLFLSASVLARTHRLQTVGALGRLRGLGHGMSVAFVVAALSLVGLPPMAGFFSKWYLLVGALAADAWPLALLVAASALLSALYVFRLIEHLLSRPEAERAAPAQADAPTHLGPAAAAMAVSALALIALGLGSHALAQWLIAHAMPPTWQVHG